MSNLESKSCEPCNRKTPKLTSEEVTSLLKQVNDWRTFNNLNIFKLWTFKNFAKPLQFVNAIAEIAEKEGHHPNINFGWGYVEITIWTYAINGLSKNDFILAAKIDAIVL